MNKRIMIVIAGAIWALGLDTVFSQPREKEPAPEPPLIIQPEKVHWILTCEKKKGSKKGAEHDATAGEAGEAGRRPDDMGDVSETPYVKSVESIIVGKKMKRSVYWSNGKKQIHYRIGGMFYTKSDREDKPFMQEYTGNPGDELGIESGVGYCGTDWVNAKCFEGTVRENGVDMHHYRAQGGRAVEDMSEDMSIEGEQIYMVLVSGEAWIDAESRLPVKVVIRDFELTYRYLPPPADIAVDIPEEFVKAVEEQEKRAEIIRSNSPP